MTADQAQAIIDLLTSILSVGTELGSAACALLLAAIFVFGFDTNLPK